MYLLYMIDIVIIIIVLILLKNIKTKEHFKLSDDDIKDIKYLSGILNNSKTSFDNLELFGNIEVNNIKCNNITNNNITIKQGDYTIDKIDANIINCQKLKGNATVRASTESYFKDLTTEKLKLGGLPPFDSFQIPTNLKCSDLGLEKLTKDKCEKLENINVSNITKHWKEGCMYSHTSEKPYYNTYSGEGSRGNYICKGTCNKECKKNYQFGLLVHERVG